MNLINQAKKIRKAWSEVDFTDSSIALLQFPVSAFDNWQANNTYNKGQIISHKGIKYLCMSNVFSQEHQPPDMENGAMLAVYKPYRDNKDYDWLYGEYCLKGYKRKYNDSWYIVISDNAGANIYPPDLIPAVWQLYI